MKRGKYLGLAVIGLALLPVSAWAQASEDAPVAVVSANERQDAGTTRLPPEPDRESGSTDIEAGVAYEDLTRDRAPWRRAYLLMIKRIAERKAVYGSLEETSRFSEKDTELNAGLYYPLSRRWTAVLEAGGSPTHRVLAKWSALGQIEYSFGRGWGAHAGLRHREYNTATVNVANFGVEKYIKSFRLAYTFYTSHLEKAGYSATHRVETNYYYGNSALNLSVARGRELENILPAGVLRSDVKLINLSGTHWFAPAWAVSYGVSWHDQGTIYTRRGLTFALRRRL
jgi:YaiO family outer membrane protein